MATPAAPDPLNRNQSTSSGDFDESAKQDFQAGQQENQSA
jgi:hypothetical protein